MIGGRCGIEGIACVTPIGCSLDDIWRRINAGETAPMLQIANPETGEMHLAARVPQEFVSDCLREPRLRRSSGVSLFAAAAGKAAIANSGIEFTPAMRSRLAIVLGVSSGGVQYTRRFYEQIVKQGANAASPLLFPETVYNAPASHMAAMLGVDGATYTLAGDGTVGIQALNFGAQLLALGDADHVLVVATEELDWILLEAHHDWRLTTTARPPTPHQGPHTGVLLAEGAAAVLLGRNGTRATVTPHPGRTYFSRAEATAAIDRVLEAMARVSPANFVVSGGNGSWSDDAIEAAVTRHFPKVNRPFLVPKQQFGEALGAGSLLQVVVAVDALTRFKEQRGLVAALGWNQQAAAAIVERAG